MRITNVQIYEFLTKQIEPQIGEIKRELNELNGRVRKNSEAVVVALDRTKRIGQEIDDHQKDQGAHGGATAKIHVSGNVKVALITLAGGIVAGGLLGKFFDVFSAYLH